MRNHFISVIFVLGVGSVVMLYGCTALSSGSESQGSEQQPAEIMVESAAAPSAQPTDVGDSFVITPIPITIEVVVATPFEQATPDRVATAVEGTRIAFQESTAIAATLTALAPPPTVTPFQFPTVPLPTSTPRPPINYASLINQHTQECLTVQGNSIVQASCTSSPNQLWQIQNGDGPFRFISKTGSCLSFSDVDVVASTCNGSPVWALRRWGDYNTIEDIRRGMGKSPHGGPNHPRPAILEYGIYFQIMDGGNCVDVDGWNHDEGGRIIYWPCNGTIGDNANQLWAFYK